MKTVYRLYQAPRKDLINTLIDKIVIDENRNITIIFKYDVIPEINFMYENRYLVRNPYGKKGKNRIKTKISYHFSSKN